MKLINFGTAQMPLRPSSLDALIRCPLSIALQLIDSIESTSGPAADTGSLTHAAVAAWHLNDRKLEVGLAAIRDSLPKFPLGDPQDAERFFRCYVEDPRNNIAEVFAVEQKVKCVIDADPDDPTGEPIHIQGTLDQIRIEDGVPKIFDLKTGSPEGWVMLHTYAFQQSAYTIAASQTFGFEAQPGALIRASGWRKRGVDPSSAPPGVFFYMPWSLEDCYRLMKVVAAKVAEVRRMKVAPNPGHHCSFCPIGGLDTCLPRSAERLIPLEVL